jgi:hypothetical protein
VANDRIWVRCKTCQAYKLLFKYYPSGGYCWDDEEMAAFLNEHITEHRGQLFNLEGEPGFELFTESERP